MPTTDPNAYGSSWYAATGVASPPRAPLSAETDVDVCVIGAGLAGLTLAREVARRGWSVLVLEAQRIAWNASGRNDGVVRPGFAAGAEALIARVGLDRAKALWALSEAGAEYVRDAARDMPHAALTENGWLHVSQTDRDGAMQAEHDWHALQFGANIEVWSAEQVREVLYSPRYFGALHYPHAFSIHPLNYAYGLAAEAEAHGARICEDTPALEIDPVGVRKRVATRDARVRASHVVLAGNVHLGELAPNYADTLLPVFGTVVATAPLGEALHEAIRYRGAVSDTALADHHYRATADGRLIWSGRSTVWHGRPQRSVNTLLEDIARVYPQLKNVKAEYAWTGTIGSTVHGMPQIGEISPGLWLLSGFGRLGLNTTAMGGELIARAIVEGDRTWQLFQPFAMVWSGGRLGQAVQQGSTWSSRARERVGGWLAHQRARRRGGGQIPIAPPLRAAYADATMVPAEPAIVAVEPPAAPAVVAVESPPQPPEIVEETTLVVPEPQPAVADGPPPPKRRRKRRKRNKGAALVATHGEVMPAGDEDGAVVDPRPRQDKPAIRDDA